MIQNHLNEMEVPMTLNIQNLLGELMGYTIAGAESRSSEANDTLSQMRTEFEILKQSNAPDKQSKMIALFMGGTIAALEQDDLKYYADKLYTGNAIKEVWKSAPERNNIPFPEYFYLIGEKALTDLPNEFSRGLFQVKIELICGNGPKAFFPDLDVNHQRITLLVDFCIKNKANLNKPEYEYQPAIANSEQYQNNKFGFFNNNIAPTETENTAYNNVQNS